MTFFIEHATTNTKIPDHKHNFYRFHLQIVSFICVCQIFFVPLRQIWRRKALKDKTIKIHHNGKQVYIKRVHV